MWARVSAFGAVLVATSIASAAPRGAVSLATADLDGDGRSEIIGGFDDPTGCGVLRWISTGEGSASPVTRQLLLPIRPDDLAAGDFDADGDTDVVVAERGAPGILLLRGDGKGELTVASFLARERTVAALAAADVDRSDGLADIVVAVTGSGGPALLIFESPEGASRALPEEIALPSEASSIAVANLAGDAFVDVAAACGSTLAIVLGRDRRLGLDSLGSRPAQPPELVTTPLPGPVVALASGRFIPGESGPLDLLLLQADGTLALRSGRDGEPQKVASPVLAASSVNGMIAAASGDRILARLAATGAWQDLALDAAKDGRVEAKSVHETTALPPSSSVILALRAGDAGRDVIVSWPDPDDAPSVLPASPLSTFIVNTTADTPDASPGDGTCLDSTGFCSLRAAIQEANAKPGVDSIVFALGTGTPTITPTNPLPTIMDTVSLLGNTGGATRIELNGIGAVPGAFGLRLGFAGGTNSGGSLIRGFVINRFAGPGILIETAGNRVEGCLVGTDAFGHGAVPGNGVGIVVLGPNSVNDVIGGATTSPGTPPGNIVSGNVGDGIEILGNSPGNNLIQGNLVGPSVGGSSALGNAANGIHIHGGASYVMVGGSAPSLRNVISGNGPANCAADGVEISGSVNNAIRGNFIGMDVTGANPLGNGGNGVAILDAEGPSAGNVIGGTSTGDGNTISANGLANGCPGATADSTSGSGVRVSGGGSTSNTAAGNNVGTTSSGVVTIIPGNAGDAVRIDGGASWNVIGGTVGVTSGECTGACNRIAHSEGAGVTVRDPGSVGNAIRANVIASNTALGIDLGADGVTQNDFFDPDEGPNHLQNFPVITSAFFDGVATGVAGVLDSTPGQQFDVELFANVVPDASGFGEGRIFLGTTTVMTDSQGRAPFFFSASGSFNFLSATATDGLGNTSEFARTFTNPGEARQLMQTKGPGTSVVVSYAPACAATDHVVYWGVTPFSGGVTWIASTCGLGVSGSAAFDPGTPPVGRVFYSVIVGQNGNVEGSYGELRPEAIGVGLCDLPQARTVTCP